MVSEVSDAVRVLRARGLVAFPTETVYGLGADATNSAAVRRIFAAKGRPGTNPLIVHVWDSLVARRYAREWPAKAEALAARFWPGPLTLVVFKSDAIVPVVSAGRETVGLRAPDHPLALELLRAFDGPLAAPSANRSNRVSPTTADHVRSELGDAVDLILDGGPCRVGIESTVLDLTISTPIILRPGAVTREQIEQVIGPVEMFGGHLDAAESAKSPGQQPVHYSPITPAYRFEAGEVDSVRKWLAAHPNLPSAVVALEGSAIFSEFRSISSRISLHPMPAQPADYARELYATLRCLDERGLGAILVELPPAEPEWHAVRDRLVRATRAANVIAHRAGSGGD